MLKTTSDILGKLLTEQINAMPRGFNDTRFLQNCITVLRDTKDIEKCTPMSVARTMLKGAYLGLDFFRKECYAIPYGDQLNFQTDYKGEIKLCKTYSGQPIQDIYAKIVREGDVLNIRIEGGKQLLDFTPLPFNEGKIVGAFAVVYYENGAMVYDAMSPKEIEDIRQKYSKAPNSPAWQKSLGEMYKKVVLRRLIKLIDLHFDRAEQDSAFEEGATTTMDPKKQIVDINIPDPFDEALTAGAMSPTDQGIIDGLKAKYPTEEEWQIEARFKEIKEAKS